MTDGRDGRDASARAGRDWLSAMPPDVAGHRDLLAALLERSVADPSVRWLELGCSLARAAGDAHSDIDCGAGLADAVWPDALAFGHALTGRLATVVDQVHHALPGPGGESAWHVVTLYDSGIQLSLVFMRAAWRRGLPPRSVALLDADGTLAKPWTPANMYADGETARQWAALGWIALGDLAKYLDRQSPWEARQRLDEARDHLWRLWAVAHRVMFPEYGLTSVLDQAGTPLPLTIERTVAGLGPAGLRAAGRVVAELLTEATASATEVVAFSPPDGLRRWAIDRLAEEARPA